MEIERNDGEEIAVEAGSVLSAWLGLRDRTLLKPRSGKKLSDDIEVLDQALGLGLCCLDPETFDEFEAIIDRIQSRHKVRAYDL